MGVTAEQGPLGTFGTAPFGDSNPQAAPNFWHKGDMILDPRQAYTYNPGNPDSSGIFGWETAGMVPLLDCAPVALSATLLASAVTPTPGTPLTLITSSATGATVGLTIQNSNGQSVSGLIGLDVSAARTATGTFTNGSPKITFSGNNLFGVQVNDQITLTTSGTLPAPFATGTTYYVAAIGNGALMLAANPDGTPISATTAGSGTQTLNITAPSSYYNGGATGQYNTGLPAQPPVIFGQGAGQGGPVRLWNPNWALSRCVSVVTNADDTGGFYTVAGFDIYGMPMSQKLTGVSSGTVTTTKAFKYVQSVTPSGTINSTAVNVGTADLFGLPLRTDWAPYLFGWYNNATMLFGTTASTTFNAADIQTATQTSGDVRGTIYGGSASDGTKRYIVFWNPSPLSLKNMVGLVGQTQA